MSYLLQITEANHEHNEFYTLGGAGFESEAERAENIASISRDLGEHVCDNEQRCYLLDILGEDGFSRIDDFEISEATAHQLLGVDDFEPLREAERAMVTAAWEYATRNHEVTGG